MFGWCGFVVLGQYDPFWRILGLDRAGNRFWFTLNRCVELCCACFFLFIYCFWVVGVWSLSPLAALFACVVFFWAIFAVFGLSQPFLTLLARLLSSVLKLP